MKGRIECIRSSVFFHRSWFACLLIFSLVLSSLSPLVARAASQFDNSLNLTDKLEVVSAYYSDRKDISYNYTYYMQACDAGLQSDGITNPQIMATFNQAMETGSWSAYMQGTGSGNYSVIVVWSLSPANATFSTSNGIDYLKIDKFVASVTLSYVAQGDTGWNTPYTIQDDNIRCQPYISDHLDPGDIPTGGYALSAKNSDQSPQPYESKLFFSTATIDYPAGYEGEEVPGNGEGLITIKPDFTYSVNNKDVQAKDYNYELPEIEPDEGYTIQGYSVEWSLFKCGSYSEIGNVCEDSELLKYQILDQNDSFNYSVADYADYHLQANYIVQQCYRYPSYPTTPDYCFYVDLDEELPEYEFLSTTVHLDIDGSSISGDTREGECDESGFCTPPSPYEDCSTYGLDVVGGLGCVIRNFGVWLTNTLKMLFIPSASFFNELFTEFGDFFNKKLGFIAYPITFLITFFTDVMDAAGSPTCKIEGGTLFGVSTDVDLCTMQQSVPVIYNGIITFIRASVAFALIFALWRKYHDIVSEGGK